MEVKNKKIIITGGANGMGKEMVKILLNEGAEVTALDINKDALKELENEMDNKNLKTYEVDISDKESIKDFKEKYIKESGEVDILINNAGIIQPFKDVEELDDEVIDRVMNINFFGPVNLTRLFIKELKSRDEAYIVNLSSMGGFFPFPHQSIYGASKAALKIFSEGLYGELLNTNVKVMVVFPGAIKTNIMKNSNIKTNIDTENTSYKMTLPDDAAKQIIDGIKKNKFKLYVGSDAKFMKKFYKFNSELAIKTINKKMGGIK